MSKVFIAVASIITTVVAIGGVAVYGVKRYKKVAVVKDFHTIYGDLHVAVDGDETNHIPCFDGTVPDPTDPIFVTEIDPDISGRITLRYREATITITYVMEEQTAVVDNNRGLLIAEVTARFYKELQLAIKTPISTRLFNDIIKRSLEYLLSQA